MPNLLDRIRRARAAWRLWLPALGSAALLACTPEVPDMLALDVLDKAAFASAAALAAKAENAAAAALLADAEHKKYAPQPKKQRYDFDF